MTSTTDKEFAEYVAKVTELSGIASMIAHAAAMEIIHAMAGGSEKLAVGAYGATVHHLVATFVEASAANSDDAGKFVIATMEAMQGAQKRGEYVREQRAKAKAQKPA